jgi:hypothetical protein
MVCRSADVAGRPMALYLWAPFLQADVPADVAVEYGRQSSAHGYYYLYYYCGVQLASPYRSTV